MNSTTVAITRCSTYSSQDILDSLRVICDSAGMPDPRGKTVLLKPNILSDALPEKAITTRPEVMQAMIKLLKERGAARILVGDSPGINGPGFLPRLSGIDAVCKAEGVIWCDFSKDTRLHTIPGTYGRRLPLPTLLEEVDLLISMAKMKTHQLMYVTGCVKNLFGTVPGLHKSPCHMMYPTRESFSRMMAGLYSVLKPSFGIMDAVIAMEGAGPAGGTPRHMGLLLASTDCTALDVAQSTIMGYEPLSIPLTKELLDRKYTSWHHLDQIFYPLLDANQLVVKDYQRIEQNGKSGLFSSLIGPFFTRYLRLRHQRKEARPLFIEASCIACGKCVRICPGKALELHKEHRIIADYNACIRCYCCHEVCPADAIEIEKRI